MKRLHALISKKSKALAGIAIMLAAFAVAGFPSYAAEGKVKGNTNIRAQTSTDSEVVGSAPKGKTIDLLGAYKDGAGTIWYKVAVKNGGYGYIRSDRVETSANIPVSASTSAVELSAVAPAPAETVPTAIGEQPAQVKSNKNVNVRSGASTQHSSVASLPNGTAVTLIGEANDSAGKKWYQITCSYDGKTVEGYIRSDLLAVGAGEPAGGGEGEAANPEGGGETPEGGEEGEAANPEGGETPEGGEGEGGGEGEPQPEPEEEHNDYKISYQLNETTGEYEYYFLNYTDGTQVKVADILNLISGAGENVDKLQDQADKEKVVIIILAVVIVIMFVILTVLLFKIKDLYGDYEEDEEDEDEEDENEEEEEEEEEPEPVRRRVRKRTAEEEEEPAPVKRKVKKRLIIEEDDDGTEEEESAPVRKKRRPVPETEERAARPRERTAQGRPKTEKELYAAEKRPPAKKPAPRKAQNFLVDDDEFEFEFLNMDDKDL